MEELITILIGVTILLLGYPLGKLLAHVTKEELVAGQCWFKLIILLSILGAIVGLILNIDALFFSFLFFAVVTSASLDYKKKLS